MEMEEVRNKKKFQSKAIIHVLLVLAILFLIGVAAYLLQRLLAPSQLTLDGETLKYERVFSENDFVDTLAWVNANGHEVISNSYPNRVFYYNNEAIESKTFDTFDEYLCFLLEVKYSDSLKLHNLSIPDFVVYK